MSLVFRIAGKPEDRLEVIRIQHRANSSTQPFDTYAALRLRIPLRQTATWWMLTDGERPVSALLCYPLHLERGTTRTSAFGIGGVATIPEARKQGFASQLCRKAMESAMSGGRPLGLLYSAVPPAFYERLGFSTLPACDFRCTEIASFAGSGPQADVAPIAPLDHLAALTALRRASMGAHEWHIVREREEEWRRDLAINHDDIFLGLWGRGGLEGYVRLVDDPADLEIVELAAPDANRSIDILRRVAAYAVQLGRPCLRGWLRAEHCPPPHFADAGRSRTLPMMSGIQAGDAGWFAASEYF